MSLVVPYAPGGTTDFLGRKMGEKLTEALGQPVVIENKPGGNTAIGVNVVANAAPDGHTILFTNDATFVLNPLLFSSLPYNVERDLAPVAPVAYVPLALVVNASLPVKTLEELIAYTRSRPGNLSYGSYGAGSQAHLMGEMYKKLTGTDLAHVPYKGAGPAVADVIGGQILFTFPAMDIGALYGFLAPAGTPKHVVAKFNKAVASVLADPEFVEKNMASQGMAPALASPDEFAAEIRKETARMKDIVKQSGAKVD